MNLRQRIESALVRTAARQAGKIRAALRTTVDVDSVVRSWNETHPAGGTTTPTEARAWAKVHIVPSNHHKVLEALREALATGYALGEQSATAHYARQALHKAAPRKDDLIDALNIDWDNWKPGNHPAELLVRPKGGLSSLLANAGIVSVSLNSTTLDRIGTRLADALVNGWADTKLAATLSDIIDDPKRALTIANTEMARAMSQASMDTYRGFDVEQVEWQHSDFCDCDLCTDNEDAGPIPLGEAFPSGDTEPPAHPNCICSIAPVIDYGSPLGEDDMTIELSAKAGVPGPAEVMRAQSRLAILPNPADPTIPDPLKYVESPWVTVPVPTIDPNRWDEARVEVVKLEELQGTDLFLRRKKVEKHIDNMGQALTPFRSYALIIEVDGRNIIIDGHHRLMASWLLGLEEVPVWKVKL